MKTLPIIGATLLLASMGIVGTAPAFAGSTAASLSAVFIATGSDVASSIGNTDNASVSSDIQSLSVSAAAGAKSAVAGGYANATQAVSIGGAADIDLELSVNPTNGLDFASPVTTP